MKKGGGELPKQLISAHGAGAPSPPSEEGGGCLHKGFEQADGGRDTPNMCENTLYRQWQKQMTAFSLCVHLRLDANSTLALSLPQSRLCILWARQLPPQREPRRLPPQSTEFSVAACRVGTAAQPQQSLSHRWFLIKDIRRWFAPLPFTAHASASLFSRSRTAAVEIPRFILHWRRSEFLPLHRGAGKAPCELFSSRYFCSFT